MKNPLVRAPSHRSGDSLTQAHARFARAALAIYAAAAAVAVTMLLASISQDRIHQEQEIKSSLLLQTQAQAFYLGKQLEHLGGEVMRLGLRSEVDLLDQNLGPEQSLLSLTHARSAFFNMGIAILSVDGSVLWSEPQTFLTAGTSFARQPWFDLMRSGSRVSIVPVDPDRAEEASLYVVAPILRGGKFTGALVGGIDLARTSDMSAVAGRKDGVLTILATRQGAVVYPPTPPPFATDGAWLRVFGRSSWEPDLGELELQGVATLVAATEVPDTDLILIALAPKAEFLRDATTRMTGRAALTLSVILVPLVLLVFLFRRSLRFLREAEERAMREERLRLLGEAANLIAHEVKNSLNGLRIGLDLLLRGARAARDPSEEKIVAGMRTQIETMSNFTSELLVFSKGVTPRPVEIELREFARKIAELQRDAAAEAGVILGVESKVDEVRVNADPSLTHVVLTNLVGNALDALSANGSGTAPRVSVEVGSTGEFGWVRVSDNGPGVAPAIRPSLFEPFVSGKPSGVGIGLALSRKIARAHGGDLVLEASGGGASFLLTLPREAK
ncbi:MAG: sensor histidine kinase [Acidobacteria bacterium]|nr:sensor histidine kinase [Acidobacteriota bacterium]